MGESEKKAGYLYGSLAFGRSFSILHRFTQRFVDKELKSYNINKAQMEILIVVYRSGSELNQSILKDKLSYNKAMITKLINGLEREGYVERVSSAIDKRERIVTLTEKGIRIQKVISAVLNKMEDIFARLLVDSDADELRKKLYNLTESIIKYEKEKE